MRASSVHAMVAVLERTAQVMNRYQLTRALERVPRGIETHVLRLGTSVRGGTLDFDKAALWIELGYAAAIDYLKKTAAMSSGGATILTAGSSGNA